MEFLNCNDSVKRAVRIAIDMASEHGHGYYSAPHILKALLHKELGLRGFISSLGKDIQYIEEWAEVRIEELPKAGGRGEIDGDPLIPALFEQADHIRIAWGLLEINPVCVFAAMIRPGVVFDAGSLKSFPVREKEIDELYSSPSHGSPPAVYFENGVQSDGSGNDALPSLNKFTIDKSALAAEKKIHPIVGRDGESRRMMEIMGRHSRANVLITGEAGVGKSALVDGFACDILEKNVPVFLENTVIYELDTGALLAGAAYKGEVEDRLNQIIKEIRRVEQAILFIDDIHSLLDQKQGHNGVVNILKSELSRGDFTIVATTSVDGYRKIIEPDPALNRCFEMLELKEPSDDMAMLMTETVMQRYRDFHGMKLEHSAVEASVQLARRYLKDKRLPDSSIDLLDRAMAAVKMINETAEKDLDFLTNQLGKITKADSRTEEHSDAFAKLNFSVKSRWSPLLPEIQSPETGQTRFLSKNDWLPYFEQLCDGLQTVVQSPFEEVTSQELAAIVADKTGIPVGKIQSGEKERLLSMEDSLRKRVVGQDDALKSLTDAILESRSGMNKPGQPIGSFFLLGPTGTGKTELAKALAESLFNDEKAMIRFDMSEFKEEHSAALLYGAPPGYVGYEEGGMLVNKIRQQPYSVVLFDEIEKAHPSVYDIFLQIMDEGTIHDRLGKEGSFSNAIVLFTSNVGSQWLLDEKEKGHTPTTTQLMDVMGAWFRPEFLARLTEIVPFNPITEDVLLKICDIQFSAVSDLLLEKGITVEITKEAQSYLAHKGFTQKYGARQVAGVIRNYVRRPVSRMIISGKLEKGNHLTISLDAEKELAWNVSKTSSMADSVGLSA